MSDKKEKLHWYIFSYMCTGGFTISSEFSVHVKDRFTKKIIRELVENIVIDKGQVNPILLSSTYLGYMTKKEFESE